MAGLELAAGQYGFTLVTRSSIDHARFRMIYQKDCLHVIDIHNKTTTAIAKCNATTSYTNDSSCSYGTPWIVVNE